MKKSDLKTGMVVIINKIPYVVMIGKFPTVFYNVQDIIFCRENLFWTGSAYDENLIGLKRNCNIDKVYGLPSTTNLTNLISPSINNRELIWERPAVMVETINIGGIEYSKEEIESKLKDLKPINK